MREIIESWMAKWKRGGRIEKAFLAVGALLALSQFLKDQVFSKVPMLDEWLKAHASLDNNFRLICIGVAGCILAYAIWKIWLRVPPTPAPVTIDPGPLKGGSSYGPQDGELFLKLGRERELGELWNCVQDPQVPFIAIQAESGAGKTSLLRCGLSHLLTTKFDLLTPKQSGPTPCVYCEMRPTDPVGDLLAQAKTKWATLAGENVPPPETLPELLERCAGSPRRCVVILDQFEQLREEDPHHVQIFDFLVGLAARRKPCNLTCVVAFREEYASNWINFCVKRLDAKNLPRPREQVLELFRRDDKTESGAGAVLATLAHGSRLDIDEVRPRLLEVLADKRGRISPFDLSVALLCLSQLHKTHLEEKDIPRSGMDGLIANYLRWLLSGLKDDKRAAVFAAIYFGLLERNSADGGIGVKRLAEGRTAHQLGEGRVIEENDLKYALTTLSQRHAGLLEQLPDGSGEPRYRLVHERFVQALQSLAGVFLADADKARATLHSAFQAYDPARPRHRLLTGSDLRLVDKHWRDLSLGDAADEMQKFYKRSLFERSLRRLAQVGAVAAIIFIGLWARNWQRASEWHEKLTRWQLPLDLYEAQHRLDKLAVNDQAMNDATWITASLKSLELQCPKLTQLPRFSASLTNLSLCGCGALTNVIIHDLPALRVLGLTLLDLSNFPSLKKLPALTNLDLSRSGIQNLSGLQDLPALADLKLNQNALRSLSGMGNLPALTNLNLDGNRLTNLSGLENLPILANLDLRDNGMMNLAGLGRLPCLTNLILTGNQLTNLSGLENLPALVKLDLSRNDLTNLSSLGRLPCLTHLILSNNPLTSLSGLTNLPRVKTLDLKSNPLTDLSSLELSPSVTTLYLKSEHLTNLSGLERLPNLKVAELEINRSTGLHGVERLTNLTALTLAFRNESDPGFTPPGFDGWGDEVVPGGITVAADLSNLENLRALTSLNLSGVGEPYNGDSQRLFGKRIQRIGLFGLENLRSLTNLDLHDINWTNFSGLKGLTNLVELNLRNTGFSRISDLAGLPRLRVLDLSDNWLRDLSGIEGLTSLTTLNLDRSALSNFSALEQLTNLTKLTLTSGNLTDLLILPKLPNLKTLDVNYNKLPNLLCLEQVPGVTNLLFEQSSLASLAGLEKLSELTTLELYGDLPDQPGLENLTNLARFELRARTEFDRSQLERLANLTRLSLALDELTANTLQLAKLRALRAVELSSSNGDGLSNLSELGKLPVLTNLSLTITTLDAPTCARLPSFDKSINLVIGAGDPNLAVVFAKFPNLQSLDLSVQKIFSPFEPPGPGEMRLEGYNGRLGRLPRNLRTLKTSGVAWRFIR